MKLAQALNQTTLAKLRLSKVGYKSKRRSEIELFLTSGTQVASVRMAIVERSFRSTMGNRQNVIQILNIGEKNFLI